MENCIGFFLLVALSVQALTHANSVGVQLKLSSQPDKKLKPAFCKTSACPGFTVIKKTNQYELRYYPESQWVSTSANTTRFSYRCLRKYLSGQNAKKAKVSMGVPVTKLIESDQATGNKNITMSFFLPGPNPPQPTGEGVWLERKSMLVYVKILKGLRFPFIDHRLKAKILKDSLESDKLSGTFYPPEVKYVTAGYDPPWIAPEKRTNDIWLIFKNLN